MKACPWCRTAPEPSEDCAICDGRGWLTDEEDARLRHRRDFALIDAALRGLAAGVVPVNDDQTA